VAQVSDGSTCSWPAPAKINLFLHVMGRRQDGYHDIQTIFQLLDWGDEVHIRPLSRPIISRLPVTYDVPESEDIAMKAARLLQAETGCHQGAEIGVRKYIPPGSGMGGGSSDAATVLLVLNRLWDCGLELDELACLGAALGADVPVFVLGRSAMAEGIGERLEPVTLGRRYYVLVFPDFSVSTREVFSDAMLVRDSNPISLSEALAGGGRNDCEAVVMKRFPAFAHLLEALKEWGSPVMTGTGSGIFIPMNDRKSAMSAAKTMKTLYNVRAVRGVERSPVHKKLDS
jgi:4-diphosphocytidyl-2-C-methyl-D-erythritol kinase